MKKTITILLLFVACIMISGCTREAKDADAQQAKQTEQNMKEANAQIGMPAIVNYQEKKLAKMLYELRDQEGLLCHWYLKSLDGKPVYMGKCIGYGLPYCVQFSNPERVVEMDKMIGWDVAGIGQLGTIPQPEPNGLFMPQSLSATWLMVVDPTTGDARPVYIEPEILVSPFPLPYAIGTPQEKSS